MNKTALSVGKVLISAEERRAFEIISLREKADEYKKPNDYVEAAASCVAKSIINIVTDRVDEVAIMDGTTNIPHAVELEFTQRYQKIGDNVYRCWFEFAWTDKTSDTTKEIFKMRDRFGFVYEFAATYYSKELIEATVNSLSEILGEPLENKAQSYNTYTWYYEVE